MDISQLPAMFAELEAKVADAAAPTVMAIAGTYQRAVKSNLIKTAHPPHTFTPSPPGYFPSLISGALRASVITAGPFGGGGGAIADVGPTIFYAAIQEYGHSMHAHTPRGMTWYNGGRWWTKQSVTVPARPYMWPTTLEMIANGELTAAAMARFEYYVWG